jgi:hypothetical protein
MFRSRTQIVGVVGDVRRDMEGHHYAGNFKNFPIKKRIIYNKKIQQHVGYKQNTK